MEQVEALRLDGDKTESLIKRYVLPLLAKGADNIVLGCTHYAFLVPIIRKIAGPKVNIINTDVAVAKETYRRLETAGLLSTSTSLGIDEFLSSGDQYTAQQQFNLLWGESVKVLPM